jgi:hypothetical protein
MLLVTRCALAVLVRRALEQRRGPGYLSARAHGYQAARRSCRAFRATRAELHLAREHVAMEPLSPAKAQTQTQRSLAALKLVSRLMSHELHSQSTSKTITLSRDEVLEIQTCVDLYIEEMSRRQNNPQATTTVEAGIVLARN